MNKKTVDLFELIADALYASMPDEVSDADVQALCVNLQMTWTDSEADVPVSALVMPAGELFTIGGHTDCVIAVGTSLMHAVLEWPEVDADTAMEAVGTLFEMFDVETSELLVGATVFHRSYYLPGVITGDRVYVPALDGELNKPSSN